MREEFWEGGGRGRGPGGRGEGEEGSRGVWCLRGLLVSRVSGVVVAMALPLATFRDASKLCNSSLSPLLFLLFSPLFCFFSSVPSFFSSLLPSFVSSLLSPLFFLLFSPLLFLLSLLFGVCLSPHWCVSLLFGVASLSLHLFWCFFFFFFWTRWKLKAQGVQCEQKKGKASESALFLKEKLREDTEPTVDTGGPDSSYSPCEVHLC